MVYICDDPVNLEIKLIYVHATVRVQISRVPRNPYLLNKGDECHGTVLVIKKKHHGRSWTRGPPLSPRPAPLHLAAAYHLSRASPLISSHLISSHLLVGQPVIMREKKYISNFFSINKWKFHGVQVRPLIRFNLFSQFGSRSSQESSLCSMTCITEYYY